MKHYVYLLRSVNYQDKVYVGYTTDINLRFEAHNAGFSTYTAKYRPWVLCGYMTFFDEEKALAFEKYLKTGSGKSFSVRHFL